MNGTLEATPDVRSIPLGAKRKRGRPKIPNMGMSPLSKGSVVIPPVDLGVAKTTRKRKRQEKAGLRSNLAKILFLMNLLGQKL